MSIVRRVTAFVVGASMLLGGTQSLFAGVNGPGVVRPPPPALDAGCETASTTGEIEAEADDAGNDATSDHDWVAWRSPCAQWWQSARRASGCLTPDPVNPGRCRTTDVIRGPPARG